MLPRACLIMYLPQHHPPSWFEGFVQARCGWFTLR
jgi:hypothetical protein